MKKVEDIITAEGARDLAFSALMADVRDRIRVNAENGMERCLYEDLEWSSVDLAVRASVCLRGDGFDCHVITHKYPDGVETYELWISWEAKV